MSYDPTDTDHNASVEELLEEVIRLLTQLTKLTAEAYGEEYDDN